jgi:hypothetical protein
MADQRPGINARRERQAQLTAKAWQDEAFRAALLRDPKTTIARELGITIPDTVQINVVQESPTQFYLVLPPPPEGELSEQDLQGVSGGAAVACHCYCHCYCY